MTQNSLVCLQESWLLHLSHFFLQSLRLKLFIFCHSWYRRRSFVQNFSGVVLNLNCYFQFQVQYVALRNINLIVQKRPDILKHEMKVFFVKYNDPIYVKLEKLDIMIRLASQANIAQVLSELKEYATEVDVDFVRKAVRAIGRCAIKVEQSAERCVATLLDLIQTKVITNSDF